MTETRPISADLFHRDPGTVEFEPFFEDVFPALFRYCLRLTGDADAAEDVAQEAFVRFLDRGIEGPTRALRVWVFKVATHLVRDRYRVGENRRRLLAAHPVNAAAPDDPERSMERDEVVTSVRSALDKLEERDRQLLLMREEGFSYREMAEMVGVKATSVGTLLARAQERFVDAYRLDGAPVAPDVGGT
ncbi:MAG TPA: sigma-70 family RNA polymerase sigma factor [Longimicrobiales bacterium]